MSVTWKTVAVPILFSMGAGLAACTTAETKSVSQLQGFIASTNEVFQDKAGRVAIRGVVVSTSINNTTKAIPTISANIAEFLVSIPFSLIGETDGGTGSTPIKNRSPHNKDNDPQLTVTTSTRKKSITTVNKNTTAAWIVSQTKEDAEKSLGSVSMIESYRMVKNPKTGLDEKQVTGRRNRMPTPGWRIENTPDIDSDFQPVNETFKKSHPKFFSEPRILAVFENDA